MATMTVKNASGADETVEKPNANGRVAAAASRPVVLSTEDKAAIDLQATAAKQDIQTAAINGLVGTEYETIAAGQTNQALGATGATGDLLTGVLIIPATTSPGAVSIKDGAGSAITVFAGGADSVSTLHPFFVPLGIKSGAGAWQITTGANVSAIGAGNFT